MPKAPGIHRHLYLYLLRRHIVPHCGALAVGRITAVEVQAWLARLHGTDPSPNTVAKAYRVLAGVLKRRRRRQAHRPVTRAR